MNICTKSAIGSYLSAKYRSEYKKTKNNLSLRHWTLHMIWETMKTLPFLAGKDVVSARWTQTSKFPQVWEEEKRKWRHFSWLLSHLTLRERVRGDCDAVSATFNDNRLILFRTQAFWCSYPEGLITSKQVVLPFSCSRMQMKNPICNLF